MAQRPMKHLGHVEGEPWRRRTAELLDALVAEAPPELRAAVHNEVAWAAQRWFDLATTPTNPAAVLDSEDTRVTLELPRGLIPPAGDDHGPNGKGRP